MKPQQFLESSCWERIELSLGDPDKLFLPLENKFSDREFAIVAMLPMKDNVPNFQSARRPRSQKLAFRRNRSEIRGASWTAFPRLPDRFSASTVALKHLSERGEPNSCSRPTATLPG
jgi:hypothetical protein